MILSRYIYCIIVIIVNGVVITRSGKPGIPRSCSNIPKTNIDKKQWLMSNPRKNLCQLWECSLDLLKSGKVLTFGTGAHLVKKLEEVPHDPDDYLNVVTEVIQLKECVNVVLGHKKLNCAIHLKSFKKITACSLGVDHKQKQNLQKVGDLFNTTFNT